MKSNLKYLVVAVFAFLFYRIYAGNKPVVNVDVARLALEKAKIDAKIAKENRKLDKFRNISSLIGQGLDLGAQGATFIANQFTQPRAATPKEVVKAVPAQAKHAANLLGFSEQGALNFLNGIANGALRQTR